MWKKILIIGALLLLLVGLAAIVDAQHRSRSRKALEDYITELRAQGEALTWQDLGYPPQDSTNTSMNVFLSAVSRLGNSQPSPGELNHMHFVGPGIARVGWKVSHPPAPPATLQKTNLLAWRRFIDDMDRSSNALADIRVFLDDPPRYFPINLTNPIATGPRNPFVQKRTAAQWLAADALAALHEGDKARSAVDLHALTQLAQLHRDDPTLVNAMIRVAVARLGLEVTWEALQAEDWTDEDLSRMQKAWQDINLEACLERGMVGERAWVPEVFKWAAASRSTPMQFMSGGGGSWTVADLPKAVLGRISHAYWRIHMDEDQLLYLQMMQARIDILRQLKTNAPAIGVIKAMTAAEDEQFTTLTADSLAKYRYAVTCIAMPNYKRAVVTTVEAETQRRMTTMAIVLTRYQLKHGCYPETLASLIPEFLSTVSIDPMSGQPFGYHTNSDGSFTVYSVGEDDIDDGGDPTTTEEVTNFDLWSGRDAVWPKAVANSPDSDR